MPLPIRRKSAPDRTEHAPRKGPARRENVLTGVIGIIESFGFRAIEFDRSIPLPARGASLDEAFDAFADLADALDLPRSFMGLSGRLALSVCDDATVATYDAATFTLSIPKSPETAGVAQAWSLALDHMLGDLSRQKVRGVPGLPQGHSPMLSASLPRYLQSGFDHERLDMLPPAALKTRLGHTPESPREPELIRDWMDLLIRLRWRIERDQAERTEFFRGALRNDGRQKLSQSAPERMMSRAFAVHVADRLAERGWTNQALSSEWPESRGGDPAAVNPTRAEMTLFDRGMAKVLSRLRAIAASLDARSQAEDSGVLEDEDAHQPMMA